MIYLVRSWPRLSQTFILNEVLALERRGVDLVLFSLVRSGESVVQPQVAEVRTGVRYLDDRRSLRQRVGDNWRSSRWPLATPALPCSPPPTDLAKGYATASTWECFSYDVQVAAAVVRPASSRSLRTCMPTSLMTSARRLVGGASPPADASPLMRATGPSRRPVWWRGPRRRPR